MTLQIVAPLTTTIYNRNVWLQVYDKPSTIKTNIKQFICGKIRFVPFGRDPDGFNVEAPSLFYKPVSFYIQMF